MRRAGTRPAASQCHPGAHELQIETRAQKHSAPRQNLNQDPRARPQVQAHLNPNEPCRGTGRAGKARSGRGSQVATKLPLLLARDNPNIPIIPILINADADTSLRRGGRSSRRSPTYCTYIGAHSHAQPAEHEASRTKTRCVTDYSSQLTARGSRLAARIADSVLPGRSTHRRTRRLGMHRTLPQIRIFRSPKRVAVREPRTQNKNQNHRATNGVAIDRDCSQPASQPLRRALHWLVYACCYTYIAMNGSLRGYCGCGGHSYVEDAGRGE